MSKKALAYLAVSPPPKKAKGQRYSAEIKGAMKPETLAVFKKISDPKNKELFSREAALKAFSHLFSA